MSNIFIEIAKNYGAGDCNDIKKTYHNCKLSSLEKYIDIGKINRKNIEASTKDFVYCGYGKSHYIPSDCVSKQQLNHNDDAPVTLIFETKAIFPKVKEIRPFDSGFFNRTNKFLTNYNWEDPKFNMKSVEGNFIGKDDLSICSIITLIDKVFVDYQLGKLKTESEIDEEKTVVFKRLFSFYNHITALINTEKIERLRLLTIELLFKRIDLWKGNVHDIIVAARTFKTDDVRLKDFINKFQIETEVKLRKESINSFGAVNVKKNDNGNENRDNDGNNEEEKAKGIWEYHIKYINQL